MRIGVPSEIKNHEYRVGMTPAGVHALVEAGHEVIVHHPDGLHERITDGWPDEAESMLFEGLAHRFGFR